MSLIAIVAVAGLALIGWLAHLRLRQLEQLSVLHDDFFHAASILVEDDRTPDIIVEFVDRLSVMMWRRRTAWYLLLFLARGKMTRLKPARHARAKALDDAFWSMPEPLQRQFVIAAASSMLAASYRDMFIGTLLRRISMYMVKRNSNSRYNGGDDARTLVTAAAA